jgi:hypothetical protein
MLGACRLTLVTWIMALLPLMVLKEPYRWCTPAAVRRLLWANDLIPAGIFNAHRSKHLKLICPSKLDNLYTDCPEAVPDMLHQFF